MAKWEPLPDGVPVDIRRLATQLRRMKDRSGMTVPALAARTSHPVESWERAFAARAVPPLDAVEVLAQASGADYERADALWRLAEKAAASADRRGSGKPVPHPDPLDPLAADEGLPGRRRRFLLLATVGLLATAALVAVIVTAGTSTGRAPGGSARPTGNGPSVPESSPTPRAPGSGAHPPSGEAGPGRAPAAGAPAAADRTPAGVPSAATGSLPPPAATTTAAPPGPGGGGTPGTPTPTSSPPVPTPSPSPTPSPTHSQLCIGLIVLGVCIG